MNCIILFLLTVFGSIMPDNSQKISPPKKIDIYIQVHFKTKNGFAITYSDTNYRHVIVKFENNKEGDTILYRKIRTDKPTVFYYYKSQYEHQFIGFNDGDTISFEMNNSILSYIGKDKRNYIVNEIFKKVWAMGGISIQEFANQQVLIEEERTKRLNALTNFVSLYPIDESSVNTIKNQINLSYFYQLFDINFSGVIPKNWVNPYFNKFDSIAKNTNILNSIYSQYNTAILYNLIQYGTYLNKSQNTDILDANVLDNVKYLNPLFYKTKYLDGLIFIVMDRQIKTYDDRKKVLAKLKNYMLDNSDPIQYTKKQIDNKVLNSHFVNFQNKQVIFKDLLNVKEKIIVFDFWASWCVPCIGEIPYLKSKSKKLTDIKFISISLDKVSSDWLIACNKYDMKSNTYRIINVTTNELLRCLEIRNIPRFLVMTNKGEILSDDFFRTSEANFEIDLKRILDAYK